MNWDRADVVGLCRILFCNLRSSWRRSHSSAFALSGSSWLFSEQSRQSALGLATPVVACQAILIAPDHRSESHSPFFRLYSKHFLLNTS